MRRLLAIALGVCLLAPASGQAQAPEVASISPLGVLPGSTTDITLTGANLAAAKGILLGFPCKIELAPGIDKNGTEAGKVVYRVTTPPETPVGLYTLRFGTDKGISNLRLILVDDLPTVAELGTNKTPAMAQALTLPVAIEGAAEAETFDYYKVAAKKGQRISFEVYARRLGSQLDPIVRVIAPDGKEVLQSDDEPGLLGDSRGAFVAQLDGDYLIELRDITYVGSVNHRYRLRVANFPLVTTAYPMGGQKGVAAAVGFAGPGVDGAAVLNVNLPKEAKEFVPIAAKMTNGQGSALVTLIASDLPELIEKEPNDKPEQATPVVLPCAISGRLDKRKDYDYYQFEAKKGQRFLITGHTRRFGAPTDLLLRLYDAKGTKMGESDDAPPYDGIIDFNCAADGLYRIGVEDLNRLGGLDFVYRIEIRPYQPGFSLVMDTDRLNPPKGGVLATKVTATRRDFAEDIVLSVEGLPAGAVVKDNIIAKGKNDTVLQATMPDGMDAGTMMSVRVIGTGKAGDQVLTAVASLQGDVHKKSYPTLAQFPPVAEGSVGLGVGPVFPAFFELSVSPTSLLLPQTVGLSKFKVVVKRLNNFQTPVNLTIEGLPKEITAAVTPIAQGKNDVEITLTGAPTLPTAEYKLKIVASGVHMNQPKTLTLDAVSLKVDKPLQVFVAPAGPIQVGGKQKVKVTVVRHAEDLPITLAFKNLPKGITAPAGLTIPMGKADVEVELTAAADATVAKVDNIAVTATTKAKGADIAVDSANAVLEVKPK